MKKQLKTAITKPKKRIMFFVGSGISINSGLPDFRKFSKHLIKSLTWLYRDHQKEPYCYVLDGGDIDEISRFIRPELLMQIAHKIAGDEVFHFYEWLNSGNPNYYHYYLATAIKCGHYVFTPNIDRLIERAYKKLYNEEIRLVVDDSDYTSFLSDKTSQPETRPKTSGKLFKVHGTIDNSQFGFKRYESIRFLLDQVGKGVTPQVKKTMEKCIKHCDLVFIGYSGCYHFSNQPVLQEAQKYKNTYWLWYDDIDNEAKEKGEKLQTGKLTPFSYSGTGDTRTMEIDAVKKFLESRKESCTVFQGNISKFIEEIVEESKDECKVLPEEGIKNTATKPYPLPCFLTQLRLFDRLYAAALFLYERRSLHRAEKYAYTALKYCKPVSDGFVVRFLLANIFHAQSSLTDARKAIEQLEIVITECKDYLIHPQAECKKEYICKNLIDASVEIVNILRGCLFSQVVLMAVFKHCSRHGDEYHRFA